MLNEYAERRLASHLIAAAVAQGLVTRSGFERMVAEIC
jgi:hypothetical protein